MAMMDARNRSLAAEHQPPGMDGMSDTRMTRTMAGEREILVGA
jgi:hypothetical protein